MGGRLAADRLLLAFGRIGSGPVAAMSASQLLATEKHRLGKNFNPMVGRKPECFSSK